MKKTVKVIALVLLLVMITSVFAGCSSGSSGSSSSAGKCFWCDGVGYARYKDASGNYVNKTCSHCGGSGRSR